MSEGPDERDARRLARETAAHQSECEPEVDQQVIDALHAELEGGATS